MNCKKVQAGKNMIEKVVEKLKRAHPIKLREP